MRLREQVELWHALKSSISFYFQFVAGRLDLLNAGFEVTDVFEQELLNESGGAFPYISFDIS